ncbi:hypothetical protein [Brevundimonas sp.]
MLIGLLFAAALAATALQESLQDQSAPSPTAAQVEAARSEAQSIIERSQVGDFFENITTTDTPQTRHKPSGMVCSFTAGDPRNAINLYPTSEGGPRRGDDASCGTWWGTTYVTNFATRYPQQYEQEQLFGSAVRDIRENWQNVVALEGNVRGATIAGQEPPLVGVFNAERNGQRRTTAVVLRNIGDWSFKVRATGEADDPEVSVAATFAFGAAIPGGWEIIRSSQ